MPKNSDAPIAKFEYSNDWPSHTASYLWPVLLQVIRSRAFSQKRVFDLGCGNGATAEMLSNEGFDVTGVDPSASGIEIAKRRRNVNLRFHVASSHDDLAEKFGTFPLVVSLEAISFVLDTKLFAQRIFELVEDDGVAVVSATYHGFLKNLMISIVNGWDKHLDPLSDNGLIKFFSPETLGRLLTSAGFKRIEMVKAGRIPMFAKSMVAIVYK